MTKKTGYYLQGAEVMMVSGVAYPYLGEVPDDFYFTEVGVVLYKGKFLLYNGEDIYVVET